MPHPFRPSERARSCVKALLLPLAAAACALSGCQNNGMPNYPDGYREFAYVANTAGASVSVLDLVLLDQSKTLSVGAQPVAVTSNPRRNEVYVVSRRDGQATGLFTVIDTDNSSVAATLPLGRASSALAVSPDGRRAYVLNSGSDSVSVLDLDARRVVDTLAVGPQPSDVALADNGLTVAVTSAGTGSVRLYQVHPGGKSLTERASYSGCPGATSPAILPGSSKLFVACGAGHQVMVIGLAMPPDDWNARQDSSLLKDRVLALLDVGQNPTQLAVKPDGGEIFVSNTGSASISEIATTQNEVGSTYPIGNRPAHAVVNQDGTRLWVSASGTDSVSLYSIEDGKFVSSLPTGGGPDALAFSADQHLLLAADARTGDVAVLRTQSKLGPVLLTMLPAGSDPTAIAIKAMPAGK